MDRSRLTLLQLLFDAGAERYARDIAPVLFPLTADFAAFIAPDQADQVLDLGTGTGSLARLLAPHVRQVTGVDISPASLRIARDFSPHPQPLPVHREGREGRDVTETSSEPASPLSPLSNQVREGIDPALPPLHFEWRGGQGVRPDFHQPRLHYVRADLHRLPFRDHAFTLAAASLGLNAADPGRALRAIRRVLAPGGRLAIQEWGAADPLNRALDDVLAEFAVENPAEPLARLRAGIADTRPLWSDHLQEVDDYREWLEEAGFTVEETAESTPLAIPLLPDRYLTFWLAWTDRFEEVRALDEETRAAFTTAARQRLATFALPGGQITWSPAVFRVLARA